LSSKQAFLFIFLKQKKMVESTEKILKIVGIYFAPLEYLASIVPNNQTVSIAFHQNRAWEEIKFASAQFDETETETDSGSIFRQRIKLVLAGDDAALQLDLLEMKTCKPVIKIEFDNEKSKFIGSSENYCNMNFDSSSINFETKKEISFERQSSHPALFIA